MHLHKFVLFFSGYNQRAIIAFNRSLKNSKIIPLIFAKDKDDSIFQTDYAEHVINTRKSNKLDALEIISILKNKGFLTSRTKILLAPSSETLNLFFLAESKIFECHNIIIPLIPLNSYKSISNKFSFSQICIENALKVPEEYDIENLKIPFVAKPKEYTVLANNTSMAPEIIWNHDDKLSLLNNENISNYYFQEYVEGQSYYLLYYIDKNKKVYKLSQKNLVQQANGKSIIAAETSNIHNETISFQYENMLTSLGYRGLIMIELIEQNGIFYMIEANPRMWGPSQLFIDSGINLFQILLYDYGLILKRPSICAQNSLYFWRGGINLSKGALFYYLQKDKFNDDFANYLKNELYNRPDTVSIYTKQNNMNTIDKLISFYEKTSKHSNYQILAPSVSSLIKDTDINVHSRFEKERLDYITSKVDINEKTIIDIGANTGYFTFESIANNSKKVTVYEGNYDHATFIKLAGEALKVDDKLTVYPKYYEFEKVNSTFDIGLVLNVLHHIGSDYSGDVESIPNAKKQIIEQLKHLSKICKILVFQLGYCWHGNTKTLLFEKGTKSEMIDYIIKNCGDFFELIEIGIAGKINGQVSYHKVNDKNIDRDDTLGEFLNRPLFILKSKSYGTF